MKKFLISMFPGLVATPQGYISFFYDAAAKRLRANSYGGVPVTIGNGAVAGAPAVAGKAVVTIDPAGTNNNISYSAVNAGTAGNAISIQYVIGGTAPVVTVEAKRITVTAPITTLASAVITAVNNNLQASSLVLASASGTVTGVIAAVGRTLLSGGTNGSKAKAGDLRFDANFLYVATTDTTDAATTGWKKIALAAL